MGDAIVDDIYDNKLRGIYSTAAKARGALKSSITETFDAAAAGNKYSNPGEPSLPAVTRADLLRPGVRRSRKKSAEAVAALRGEAGATEAFVCLFGAWNYDDTIVIQLPPIYRVDKRDLKRDLYTSSSDDETDFNESSDDKSLDDGESSS